MKSRSKLQRGGASASSDRPCGIRGRWGRWLSGLWLGGCLSLLSGTSQLTAADSFIWPTEGRLTRPWTYWWWMGSAVDETNVVRELTRYRDAEFGGVHIIPIYGAKGW